MLNVKASDDVGEKALDKQGFRKSLSFLLKLWKKLMVWNKKPDPVLPELSKPIRRKVDTQAIRARIAVQGWSLREIPIKKNHPDPAQRKILQWKVTAVRNGRSIEVGGETIDDAMKNIGKTLGVIPR